jgi:hypothetical protein
MALKDKVEAVEQVAKVAVEKVEEFVDDGLLTVKHIHTKQELRIANNVASIKDHERLGYKPLEWWKNVKK